MPFLPPVTVAAIQEEVSVSASQFKDFTRCQRLWWFKKVAKIKEREKQALVIGHAFHSCAEIYHTGKPGDSLYPSGWNEGLEPEESVWVKKSVDYAISLGLWQRTPGRLVEFPLCMLIGPLDKQGMPLVARSVVYEDENKVRKIRRPTMLVDGSPLPAGALNLPHYNGFIDILDLDLPLPLIGDHKTAKSRRYTLTPEKLSKDVQMCCYSAGILGLLPEAQKVRLRHNVFLKDPAAPTPAYPVDVTVDRLSIEIHWQRVIDWSQQMQALRRNHPAGAGLARANNWHGVVGAVEKGCPDECGAYGGCPFKDVCFGNCSAEQLLARLDSPDPIAIVKQAEQKFGLRLPTLQTQEKRMAFARPAPALAAGMDVYVLDPENSAHQYRARIDVLDVAPNPHTPGAPPEAAIILWPDADIEPDFKSVGIAFRICVPRSSLMIIPLPTATIIGYSDTVAAEGAKDGIEWKPAAKQEAKTAETTFGLRPSTTTVPPVLATAAAHAHQPKPPSTTAPACEEACPLTNTGAGIKVGDMLVVAASESKFWKPLEGKAAKVVEITPGELPGNVIFGVEIDGMPYPDVLPCRFQVPKNSVPCFVYANCGKMVHIETKSGVPLNISIEAVYNDGFMIMAGTRKVLWDEVVTIELFDEKKHVPDRQPTKEEKAEAKQAAKEEKAAEKAAAKEEKAAASIASVVPPVAADPITAVNQAIAAVEESLKAGKTTRKVVEAMMPALNNLKTVLAGMDGSLVTVPPVASSGDPIMRGAVKTALSHVVCVLNETLGKIPG